MAKSTISPERKQELLVEMGKIIEKHGKNYVWTQFASKHKVPVPTVYRWMHRVFDSGVPTQRSLRKAAGRKPLTPLERKRAERVRRRPGSIPDERALKKIASELPVVPMGPSAVGLDLVQLASDMGEIRGLAKRLVDYASTADGGVRNPRYFHQAASLWRNVIETSNRVMTSVWSVQQAERTISIMFSAIKQADGPTAERILIALQAANLSSGIHS